MTRNLTTGLLSLVLALTFGCTSTASVPDENAMVEAAKNLDAQFLDAFTRRDSAAMTALYWDNPEVVSLPPDAMMAAGPAGIQQYYANLSSMPAGTKLEMTESHYVPVGDVVLTWGTFKFTTPGPDGQPVESMGRYSDVKAERDGKWVYLMDHASAPQAMPAPAN